MALVKLPILAKKEENRKFLWVDYTAYRIWLADGFPLFG